MASLSDKETITRKTMIRKKQRSTGEHSSVWGRSKDKLASNWACTAYDATHIDPKTAFYRYLSSEVAYNSNERKGSGFIKYVTLRYMQK